MSAAEIEAAKRAANAARARLESTADALKYKSSPAVIAGDVVDTARDRVAAIGERAGDLVRERPVAASAAAALLALVLFRKPAARLVRPLLKRERDTAIEPEIVRRPGGRPFPDPLAQFAPPAPSSSIFFQE